MGLPDIIHRVAAYNCPLVLITGGEPLLQKKTPLLIETLLDQNFRVLIETNGSFDISRIDQRCLKIVDLKCPSSGESKNNDMGNIARLNPHDQLKFVIANRSDYEFAKSILPLVKLIDPGHILFSVAHDQLAPALLAKWILADGLFVRLQLQAHKTIWGEARGK